MEGKFEKFLATKAETTKSYYPLILNKFIEYLRAQGKKPEDTTEDDVRDFVEKRYSKNSSRNTALNVIKGYLRYIEERIPPVPEDNQLKKHYLALARKVPGYKIEENLERVALSMEEISHLLSRAKLIDPRHFNTFYLYLWLGVRRNELLNLTPENVDWSERSVVIGTEKTREKSRKRKLFFDDYTADILKGFLENPPRESTVNYWCSRIYDKLVDVPLSPKTFRKTFETLFQRSIAKHLLEGGSRDSWDFIARADVVVKAAMGHKTQDMTMTYTDIVENLRVAMQNYHFMQEAREKISENTE